MNNTFDLIGENNTISKVAKEGALFTIVFLASTGTILEPDKLDCPKPIYNEYGGSFSCSLSTGGSTSYGNINTFFHTTTVGEELGERIIDEGLLYNLNKLETIRSLGYNWNGNGAEPFSKIHIDNVRDLLFGLDIQPEVFPTAAQSIQIEYDGENDSYLEFQIYEDCKVEIYQVSRDGNETTLETVLNIGRINKVVNQFYG